MGGRNPCPVASRLRKTDIRGEQGYPFGFEQQHQNARIVKANLVLLVNRLTPSDFEDVLHEVVEFLTVFQLTNEISGHQ